MTGTVAVGAGGIAGCMGVLGEEPEFETDADLSISADNMNNFDVADDSWYEETGEDANPNFDHTFVTEDESIFLLYSFEIKEDVDQAEERYETALSDAGSGADEIDIADEGYVVEDAEAAGDVAVF